MRDEVDKKYSFIFKSLYKLHFFDSVLFKRYSLNMFAWPNHGYQEDKLFLLWKALSWMTTYEIKTEAPAKRSQHFNAATYPNIVGYNMLCAFGHPVAMCCDMLRHVGCCWLKFENGQIFYATFLDVAWCCSRLARLVQQSCWSWACALVRFSTPNMSTPRNRVAERVQHVAPNNVANCCV